MHPLDALAGIDAASLGTGLPAEHARAAWAFAIEGARSFSTDRIPPGRPPRAVTVVASANVFTAPIEWAWALSAAGVRVILKSARGLSSVGEALALAFPGVEARDWRGGDLEAEAAALADSDVALVFGHADTVRLVRSRSPIPVLGFGPRFGVALIDRLDDTVANGIALDHALYDGHGCMSPAAVISTNAFELSDLGAALLAADEAWPPGRFTPQEASDRRAVAALARIEGQVFEAGSWLVVALPAAHFRPRGLPRVVIVHQTVAPGPMLARWVGELGTVALAGAAESDTGRSGDIGSLLGLGMHPPARVCEVGRMQRPPASRRLHDGVDVLQALWSAARPA